MHELEKSDSLLNDVLSKIASIGEGCESLNSRLKRLNVHRTGTDQTEADVDTDAASVAARLPFRQLPFEIQSKVIQSVTDAGVLCRLSQVRRLTHLEWAVQHAHADR
jgi:hypothetical protein